MENWGLRLKEIREKNELSQNDIAIPLQKDVTQISRYERGQGASKMPKSFKEDLKELFTNGELKYIAEGGELIEEESNIVMLPYYPETYASAGGGAFSYLENSEPMSFSRDFLELHLGLKTFKNIFIINATGDSMEGTFSNGALLFVNPYENEDRKLRDGGIYVIDVDDTRLVKRVTYNPLDQSHTLISDNAVYGSIKVYKFNESAKFIGRVVGFFDRV
ncbi:MAG: S24 family peptidase [Sulfurovaceae bacterium]|nr:S24 family peptidase [Sulfurovaceae bacterium]